MKKILMSVAMLAFVGVTVAGLTGAFFSDTETSTGNTFTAGAIDLGIDNESYYNGVYNEGTSWLMTCDLDDANGPYLFFNFRDLKPGDWGEDTISLHVDNNPAWVCAEVTLTSDEENKITEPEMDLSDTAPEGIYAGRTEVSYSFTANWIDDTTDINIQISRMLNDEAGELQVNITDAAENALLGGCVYDELSVGLSEGEKSTLEISGTADSIEWADA